MLKTPNKAHQREKLIFMDLKKERDVIDDEKSEREKKKILRYIYNATRNGINKIFRVSRYYENFH